MKDFVDIKSRILIQTKLNDFTSKKGMFLLWGKSGSGKSILLNEFAKKHNLIKISKLFNDRKEFESLIKKQVNNKPILLDEVGMYEESLLESVRIHSDEFAFVLSSHKMLKLFKKEHFQTRFVASCELKSLDKIELKDYIFKKHNLFFYEKEFKFLRKIYQGNLRNIDKTLQSFKDINGFYKESKSTLYKLRLSAIEQGLL